MVKVYGCRGAMAGAMKRKNKTEQLTALLVAKGYVVKSIWHECHLYWYAWFFTTPAIDEDGEVIDQDYYLGSRFDRVVKNIEKGNIMTYEDWIGKS